MTITEFLRVLQVRGVKGPREKRIRGITYDSRLVRKGDLFVAIRGFTTDGHTFIRDAVDRGCAGVVAEKACDVPEGTTLIEVDDSRVALARLSAALYGHPSRELSLVGITGTNGKTTTSFILKNILQAWGKKVGLIGTIHYEIDERTVPAEHTTPESLDLQRYLREMVRKGAEYAVLEVSSHAIALHRIEGCSFQVAAFTNFSQDHLDFHGTMKEYFHTKTRLFQYLRPEGYAVLNGDDPRLRAISKKLANRVITCGFGEGASIRAVQRKERDFSVPGMGLAFTVQTPEEIISLTSPLMGRNNVYNILMSVGIAYALGIDRESIMQGVQSARTIRGRFERVEAGQDFLCIVDYAHTEDALRSLIQEARLVTEGKVITLFGCGGDRDRTKRAKMGAVATDLSDFVFVTSDNPRDEDPMRIIQDITKGIRRNNYQVQPDRAFAIEAALSMAGKGDTVLIAGKGHEDYQEVRGIRHHFSDREAVKKIIRQGLKGSGSGNGDRKYPFGEARSSNGENPRNQ